MHSADKARDTTLDDENASQHNDVRCIVTRHVMSVLVTVLCNQPETFALDFGDDQSRFLSVLSLSEKNAQRV